MRYVRGAAMMWAALSVAACSHATRSSAPIHVRSTEHGIVQTPPPAAKPSASPPATPSPAPTQMPPRVLPPAVAKHVVRLPPSAAPKILAVAMSETTVRRGDRVSGSVVTSSNVASVQARVGGYAMSLDKVGVGRFTLTYTVNLPWFIRGNFDLHVIATNTSGATVERVIPLTVR